MRRLPFQLPDFTRISWVSDDARETWEPRLRRITNAWIEIEWLSVSDAVRACCITLASPEQFLESGKRWTAHGLSALPLALLGDAAGYTATPVRAVYGKPFAFRLVLGSPENVCRFREAYEAYDDDAIGELLGFPGCCRAFYKRAWVDAGLVDTTWPMALGTVSGSDPDVTCVNLRATPETSNILWRWMGVRAVPHLPCSFSCQATVAIAEEFASVGRRHGFSEEMDWMLDVLRWPVEWSALHGIAEIKTPVLKVSTRTDATPCKYTVRYEGSAVPAEAARGLRFPFLLPSLPLLTESLGFKRGLSNPIAEGATHPPWYAADNGFSTVASMDAAHSPILACAAALLGAGRASVLDIGCGNGALLRKLINANPSATPFGIDLDAARVSHARELLPKFADNFFVGDAFRAETLWQDGRRFTLGLAMPGRFLEAELRDASRLRGYLKERCDNVLLYAYPDSVREYGTLHGLAAAAGFALLCSTPSPLAALARVQEESALPRGQQLRAGSARAGEVRCGSRDPITDARVDACSIDWKRVAEPQPDEHDTIVALQLASEAGLTLPALADECVVRGPFFEAKVALEQQGRAWCENCRPADLGHRNIYRASELIATWPEAYKQFARLVCYVYPMVQLWGGQDVPDSVVGSISGPGPRGFGSITATVNHHVGFAEALVHEMSHHKLRALGVEFESAQRLITNRSDEKYPSPIRYDRLRPMSAVLHAQYSYTYIAALDVSIIEGRADSERDAKVVKSSLAVIIPKLQFGLSVIRTNVQTDPAGKEFLEGFYDWSERIVTAAARLFAEFRVSPVEFSHPLAGH